MAVGVRSPVRKISPLSVDVSELLRRPGATKPLRFRKAVEGIALPLARVPARAELELDLRIDALVDGIHAIGTIAAPVDLECRRCLVTFVHRTEVPIDAVYLTSSDPNDDSYPLQDDAIDLEPAVRDAVLLALPLNPLCKPGCKGLCPVCGLDRNTMDCGHEQEHIDVRWSALEDLRRTMEE